MPVTRDSPDAGVQSIVDYWVAKSADAGNKVVGPITADISAPTATSPRQAVRPGRASRAWATWWPRRSSRPCRRSQFGYPVIAFMNPGGLRTDLLYASMRRAAGEVTYRELFDVQPFGNTVERDHADRRRHRGGPRAAVPATRTPRPPPGRATAAPGDERRLHLLLRPDPALRRPGARRLDQAERRASTRRRPTASRRTRSSSPAATASPPSRTAPTRSPARSTWTPRWSTSGALAGQPAAGEPQHEDRLTRRASRRRPTSVAAVASPTKHRPEAGPHHVGAGLRRRLAARHRSRPRRCGSSSESCRTSPTCPNCPAAAPART